LDFVANYYVVLTVQGLTVEIFVVYLDSGISINHIVLHNFSRCVSMKTLFFLKCLCFCSTYQRYCCKAAGISSRVIPM